MVLPRTWIVVLILIGVAELPEAQTIGTASISGEVRDASGGALPGAVIFVRGPGVERQTFSDELSRFTVEALFSPPPTVYALTVRLAGFETVHLQDLAVAPGRGLDLGTVTIHQCYIPDLIVTTGLQGEESGTLTRCSFSGSCPRRRGNIAGSGNTAALGQNTLPR